MNSPAASVLMCVYNERPEFLRRAAESVLAQSFTSFEFVIVDDGSTDPKTIDALQALAARDPRIRLLRKSNEGLTRSLNFGLRHCAAPVVFRHDSDDWSAPERFARQWAVLDRHPELALVGANFVWCRENGSSLWPASLPISHRAILEALPLGNAFCHGAVCFRLDAVLGAGGYRETLPCAQDYDLFWRLAEKHPVVNLPELLYFHRRTSGSVTVNKTLLQDRCVAAIRELARMRVSGGGSEDFERAWALAGAQVETRRGRMEARLRGGDHRLLAGRYVEAGARYLAAFGSMPWSLRPAAKLVRLGLYALLPFARQALFFPPRVSRSPESANALDLHPRPASAPQTS